MRRNPARFGLTEQTLDAAIERVRTRQGEELAAVLREQRLVRGHDVLAVLERAAHEGARRLDAYANPDGLLIEERLTS